MQEIISSTLLVSVIEHSPYIKFVSLSIPHPHRI